MGAEQIKSAYFLKAKEVHPDSSDEKDDARFIELTEAYNRLMYESKFGTGQIPDNDPRNDPRKPEYWDLRKRVKSEEDIRREQEIIMQNKIKEKALIRKSLIFLLVGVFFGTIFPALFVGDGEYKEMCVCDKCMLERLRKSIHYIHADKRSKEKSGCCAIKENFWSILNFLQKQQEVND